MDTGQLLSDIPAAWVVSFALGLLFRLVIFLFKSLDRFIER